MKENEGDQIGIYLEIPKGVDMQFKVAIQTVYWLR